MGLRGAARGVIGVEVSVTQQSGKLRKWGTGGRAEGGGRGAHEQEDAQSSAQRAPARAPWKGVWGTRPGETWGRGGGGGEGWGSVPCPTRDHLAERK